MLSLLLRPIPWASRCVSIRRRASEQTVAQRASAPLALAKKKQKTFEVKEVKLRPGIEDHDYVVKLKSIQRFLSEGDKVKITLRFKGREMAYHQRGMDVLKKLESEIEQLAKIEQVPTLEGKHMIMVVAPR
mgnify:CR=1 FL=1